MTPQGFVCVLYACQGVRGVWVRGCVGGLSECKSVLCVCVCVCVHVSACRRVCEEGKGERELHREGKGGGAV